MKHFEAMMRDFLLEKQRTRMQNKAAQPEDQDSQKTQTLTLK